MLQRSALMVKRGGRILTIGRPRLVRTGPAPTFWTLCVRMWTRLVPALSASTLPSQVMACRISSPRSPRLHMSRSPNDHLHVQGIGSHLRTIPHQLIGGAGQGRRSRRGEEDWACGAAEFAALSRHVSAGAAGARGDQPWQMAMCSQCSHRAVVRLLRISDKLRCDIPPGLSGIKNGAPISHKWTEADVAFCCDAPIWER
jgi:hypothetical protein